MDNHLHTYVHMQWHISLNTSFGGPYMRIYVDMYSFVRSKVSTPMHLCICILVECL